MSRHDQDISKTLETVKSSASSYVGESEAYVEDVLSTEVKSLSALEDLSLKIEMCLKKQRQVNFISREIADIVKKSS